jgi:DNA-directed RNA polymerase subunit RPC12/RpoP
MAKKKTSTAVRSSELVRCNQCGKLVDRLTKIGLAFNMGHGPVYVCLTCKPPRTAKEIIADLEDFRKGCPNDPN